MKIDVLGTAFMDVVFRKPETGFQLDNVVFSKNARISAGGNGCNLAINLAKLGVRTSFYGQIGKDYPGQVITRDFLKNGVISTQTNKNDTGISLVIVNDVGQRAVTSFQGLNNTFELESQYISNLKNDTAICGLGLLPHVENQMDLIIKKIHSIGKTIYAGTTGDTQVLYSFINNKMYENLDFLFMNEVEAKRLCKLKSTIDCGKYLTNTCKIRNVVITEGENGATLISKYDVYHVDALKVNCLDSTGAGDAFMAGFIKEYSQSHNSVKALSFANLEGSRNVQFFGATK